MKHFISSLSVINANTPPCEGRVSSRKILSLLLILFLSIGNAWAAEVTYTFNTDAGIAELGVTKPSTGAGTDLDANKSYILGDVSMKVTHASTKTRVYNSSGELDLRIYKNGGTLTFSVPSGSISKVVFAGSATNVFTANVGIWSNPTWTGDAASVTFTATATGKINTITVIYETASGGGENPGEGGGDPEDPTPGTGGESGSYTWDLSKKTYTTGTNEVTWTCSIATMHNTGTNATNYLGGDANSRTSSRFYTGNTLTITPASNISISSVVFTATGTNYAGVLKNSTWTNATAAVSDKTVTVTPTNGASAISATIGGTCGFTGVTVNYTKAASGEPEPVIVKTLKSIAVTGMKTTYEQGDIFKFNGTCTATYSVTKDGVAQADETAEVTPTSVSTPDMNTVETQTITVTYETVSTTYDITITENEVTPGTYNVLLDNVLWNVTAGQQVASVESMTGKSNDITFYTTKGSSQMYASSTQTRFYNGATFVISVPEGYLIKSITFAEPASDKKWDGSITVNTGTYTDGTKTWTGSAQEVTYTFGAQNRIANAEITYEVAPVEPTKTLTSIEITTPATQTTFWQGETFNYNGLVVTAHYSDAADEVVTPTVTGSTATAGTATVNVSYKEQSTSYTITVKAIPNTKETAYSVADAYDIIDKLGTASNVFISGTISQVDSYSDQYKSITYWISADGTTTKQLQVYSGKGLESADFAAVTDLSVGDKVIVCGTLKKYSGTYEFDKNNYLASHTPTTKDPAGLAYATTSYTANVGEAFTTPELTNPHNLVVTYSTSDASKATVDVNTGAVTIVAAGEVTITASTTGDATHDAGSASYNITISDPSLAVATLPFYFNGKQADIEGTPGMTQSGIDSKDYADAPYLKMNTTGDWLIIRFDSEPGEFSFLLKQNGSNAGTFTVYESANGENYTSVWSGGDLGGNAKSATITPTLAAASRYVKFEYTTKGKETNYGLGSISIQKADHRQEAGLAWSVESVIINQGDEFTAPTLNNPNPVSGITYETSNDEVATVTAEGEIALGSATGTATITATFAGDATYKPAIVTCTITVNEYIETIDGEWQLVTDASKLQAGMEIIIASVEVDGKYYAMSKASDNGNNRTAVESTISGDKLNPAVGTSVLTLVDAGNGTFALQAGNEKYLYAASSGANQLKEKDEIDVNGQWTITIADNVATIKAEGSSNRNWMQFNPNNGTPLFSCYAYDKPQKAIAIYKKMPDYTRDVRQGYYGTICLPNGGVMVGASIFEIAYKDASKIYFDEILSNEMVAGTPYIFLPIDGVNQIEVYYTDELNVSAGSNNGLVGSYTQKLLEADGNDYILLNNQYCKVIGEAYVGANRAYFQLGSIPTSAPAPAPGVRRVSMGMAGQNTATGVDQVQGDEVPTKMIINGQLFILRGEKMYDAQGKLVK